MLRCKQRKRPILLLRSIPFSSPRAWSFRMSSWILMITWALRCFPPTTGREMFSNSLLLYHIPPNSTTNLLYDSSIVHQKNQGQGNAGFDVSLTLT